MEKFLWNQLDIDPPPSMCAKSNCRNHLKERLTSVCNESKDFLLSKPFKKEATFLSRISYRYKNQFRLVKGFKFIRKVNQALLRIPKLKLKDMFSELSSCNSSKFVPSFQMLEFSMLRLQSLSFLLARVICTCEEVFLIFKALLSSAAPGPWDIWLTFQASISRVWVLSHQLLQKTDSWYEALFHLHSVSDQSDSWLPSLYSLPNNLLSWVNQQLIENGLSPIVTVNVYESNIGKHKAVLMAPSPEPVLSKPSINEIRVKESFSSSSKGKDKKRKRKNRNEKLHVNKCSESTDIQTLDQLKKFYNTEVALRSNSNHRDKCITKNLDPVEWDILQTILLKSMEKITKKPETAGKILSKVRLTLQVAVS